MITVAFVFLFVLHALNYYPRRHFFLSSLIAVDVLKSSWTGSLTGLESDLSIWFGHGFGISQFSEHLGTLVDTVQTYYGGVYAIIPTEEKTLVGSIYKFKISWMMVIDWWIQIFLFFLNRYWRQLRNKTFQLLFPVESTNCQVV